MARVYNFSAGPAVLPEEVLKEAAEEMLDYKGCGMSVMEMSHRSKMFSDIIETAEADLRELMNIPDNYKVLFLQGGASSQFSAIPMNLMKNKEADFIITGQWAKKAYKEASRYGKANIIASSEDKTFTYIPDCSDLNISENADYVYVCYNNTIYGTKYQQVPDTKGKILVADMSSCILSEPVNVEDFGVIYFGVQKNVGPAGVVVAVIREDLITDDVLPGTPTMLKWKTQADAKSLYNTPPCYGIYICGKVFQWLKKQGGLEAMKKHNEEKAKILYDFLDQSEMFKGTVVKEDRSLMNVPFVTGDDEMDAKFVKEAKEAGFENLKGHRTVGGMRASIYNAMPKEGVEKLVEFMKKFEEEHNMKFVSAGAVHIEPMGIYSNKIKDKNLQQSVPNGAKVAIPNDPTNTGRALQLLQQAGLITLKDPNNIYSTKLDIVGNPKNLDIIELDAAQTPRSLSDVDLAVINANYALGAQLNPLADALFLDSKDSPYANLIAVRPGDENRPEIQKLVKSIQSPEIKKFIEEKYKGAVLPAF